MPDADAVFAALARSAVAGLLERRPELATLLGEHAHDDRLTIGTAEHYDELARWCAGQLAAVKAIDLGPLSAEYRVDAQILFAQLERVLFATTELREHEWNPMQANPGRAIYLLLARDFGPLPGRLRQRDAAGWRLSRTRWRRPGRWPTPRCPRCIWRPRSASSPGRSS